MTNLWLKLDQVFLVKVLSEYDDFLSRTCELCLKKAGRKILLYNSCVSGRGYKKVCVSVSLLLGALSS